MARQPAILWFTGDWMKSPDVRSLSYAARGLWFDMLNLMHDSERRGYLQINGKQISSKALARMTGGNEAEIETVMPELKESGVFSISTDGIIYSRRMARDTKLREDRANAGSKGGHAKASKGLARTADGVGSKPQATLEDVNVNEDSSSSISSSLGGAGGELKSIERAIYAAYPRHTGPRDAEKAIVKALDRIASNADPQPPDAADWPPANPAAWLLDRAKLYATATADWPPGERDYIPHPATWFNKGKYSDDPEQWKKRNGNCSFDSTSTGGASGRGAHRGRAEPGLTL